MRGVPFIFFFFCFMKAYHKCLHQRMVKCGYVKWADDRACQGCESEISFIPRSKPILSDERLKDESQEKEESKSWLFNNQIK